MTKPAINIDKPLVSVVVPSYNHEDYIEECILAIVNQTYKNIELIVIDDGSTDHSREILERLQQQYGFTLICQENQGVSKTMNRAISLSGGKYITGSASDDVMMPDKIEKQVGFMEENPAYDLIFGKVHLIDEKSKIIPGKVIHKPFPDPVKEIPFELLIDNDIIPAPSMMFRKSAWEKCGGYNENTILEDFDLWLKIAYTGKIVYVNDYFACYRWHGKNVSTAILKMYTETWRLVVGWKDKMAPDVARRILARRDSYNFFALSGIYKKESLKYLKINHSYWDMYMLKNYLKGFVKLIFYRRRKKTVWR